MFEAFGFAAELWDHAGFFHIQQVVGDVISADIEHSRNIALWECIFHWILHCDGAFWSKIVNKMAFIRDKTE